MENFKGSIVEESLEDNLILNKFKIIGLRITDDENPSDRWHIYNVQSGREEVLELSKYLKPEKWYAHFWDENKNIIAIFKDKYFEFNYDDKDSWNEAISYGISVGIPKEQLDFLID